MTGGLAVRANLLCVTWSSGRGHVFLFDLEARLPVSSWTLPAPRPGGYSDAAGVAMDDRFHLYVADPTNDRICHFSAFGRHLADIGRQARPGSDARRDRLGTLHRPQAVAVWRDDLYVAGGQRPLRRGVQRFARDGRVLDALRATGDAACEFGAPRGLWADRDGVLVADTLHGQVQRFRRDGTYLASVLLDRPDAAARPIGVARGLDGRLLVVDAGDEPGVRVLEPDGTELPAGALAERSDEPTAVTVDALGRVYLLDRGGERVQRFAADLGHGEPVVDLAEHLDDYGSGGS